MLKYIFFLFCFIQSEYTFSQEITIEGIVLSTDSMPLQYAVVFNAASKRGTYTDSLGHFQLTLPKTAKKLSLSRLGYVDKTILLDSEELDSYNIFLQQERMELSEAVVKTKHFRRKKIKLGPAKKHKTFASASGDFSYESGIYIPNESKIKGELLGATLYLENKKGPAEWLRLRVYEPDDNLEPDEDLLVENVLIKVKPGDKTKRYIDLSSYKITLPPNGIIVSVEWLQSKPAKIGMQQFDYSNIKMMHVENKHAKYSWWARYNQGHWQNNTELLRISAEKHSMGALYRVPYVKLKIREYDRD